MYSLQIRREITKKKRHCQKDYSILIEMMFFNIFTIYKFDFRLLHLFICNTR